MIPVILPVAHAAPSRCPNCHHSENIKRVCRNCAYEYRDDDDDFSGFWFIVSIFAAAMIFLWIMFTIFAWTMPIGNQQTLVQVLHDQAQWLWALAHRIW